MGLYPLEAQNEFYNNGATIKLNNGAVLYVAGEITNNTGTINSDGKIYLTGDWTNNATFTSSGDSVIFSGSLQQLISGSQNTPFHNIIITTGAGGIQLTRDISVANASGELHLGDEEFDLNSNTLTINSSSTTAIKNTTNGYILSETDFATGYGQVKWVIGPVIGTYTIPFGSGSGSDDIPVSVDITSVGTGASGDFTVSTYPTNPGVSPNNLSYPNTVTHMNDQYGIDNSLNAADRFWMIDYTNYSANPTSTLSFNYTNTDLGGANTFSEAALMAHYWNAGSWASAGIGSITTASNLYSGLSGINTSEIWVLATQNSFLPIESINLVVLPINNQYLHLHWKVNIETLEAFEIERSTDLIQFSVIERISIPDVKIQDSWTFDDKSVQQNTIYYYRVKYIKVDGSFGYSPVRQGEIEGSSNNFIGEFFPNPSLGTTYLPIKIQENEYISFFLVNALGQRISHQIVYNVSGSSNLTFDFSDLASGVYYAVLQLSSEKFSRRLVITH